MSDPSPDDDRAVAEAVLGYLAEHPNASDTLTGIADWWVMRHQIRVSVTTMARVLQRLTDAGVLEKLGPDDQARYRLKG